MLLREDNFGVKIGEEALQISPFLQSVKFGEPSCTPSQQINLLGVKEELLYPSQNANKAENGENFLQVWEKESNQDDPKEENIQLEGPVGCVLGDFQNQDDHSFEHHSEVYHPDVENLEGFFGEAPKDFEQIIDECSFDNCHLDSNEDSKSMRYKSPTLNRSRTYHVQPHGTEGSKTNLRKRDAKRANKKKNLEASSSNMNKHHQFKSGIHPSESLKNKSGLIIKIRSGTNVILNEEVHLDQDKKLIRLTKAGSEENKAGTHNSSCSTSTLSMERQEEKSRRMSQSSVSSIDLDNNVKIF
mmetsp:Transcript_19186/g.17005  ORF Transcript_19186/g.17005 Transcript_19186/m.17005 type:complete len:300 (-) Transcript_19186:328-1227(-)